MVVESYTFQQVKTTTDELRAIEGLFRRVWPQAKHMDLEYLRWLYVQNPAGPAIGFNAWAGDTLAAHYVVIPCGVMWKGVPVKAALSLNTATHPDHRGRGLFVRLATLTYETAAAQGYHHVFGVGNSQSTHGLVKKLGFQLVGRLEARLSVLLPRYQRESDYRPVWERLWEPSDFHWRLTNPRARYGWMRAQETIVVLAHTGRWGIQAVLTVICDEAGKAIVFQDLRPVYGFKPLIWLGLSRKVRFPNAVSFNLPQALRPSPLNLVFLPLAAGCVAPKPEEVEFSTIDFDAF